LCEHVQKKKKAIKFVKVCFEPYKETKAESLLDGLQPRSREKISFLEIKEYTKMVNMASIAEKGIKEAHADYIQKRSIP
jgi:hypothetical protein